MRRKRILLACLIALGLSPGLFWRDKPVRDFTLPVEIVALEQVAARVGPFELEKLWQVRSGNDLVGGYSALMLDGGDRLVAASDAGRLLVLTRDGDELSDPVPRKFVNALDLDKLSVDIESMTRDPVSGHFWVAYENTNTIQRYSRFHRLEAEATPAAMRDWNDNTGPESMARLADGRFIVIAEGGYGLFGRPGSPGVLFSGDPTEAKSTAIAFTFAGLEGYSPVDLAIMPDGRALVLMRSVTLSYPPRFGTAIMLADPAQIRAGGEWQGELLAEFAAPLPSDNFEGLAVEENADGSLALWLVSDDNFAHHQRSLILKLRWQAWQKARR